MTARIEDVAALVRGMCRARLGEAGEDAAQEALLALWLSLDRFDPARGSFTTWAAAVTRNKVADAGRRARASRVEPIGDWSGLTLRGAPQREVVDPGDRPDDVAVRLDTERRVRALAAELPDHQHRVITARYWGGMTCTETAAALRIPVGTVKSTSSSALGRLRVLAGVTS